VGAENEAVADRVGVGGLVDVVVEALVGYLAADDGGPGAVAIIEDLEEIAPLVVGDRRTSTCTTAEA
jgi:hypothetical protein